jgi:hypothetical protein
MKIRQLLERYIIYASFHLPFRFCKQISKLCKTRLNGKAWTSRTNIMVQIHYKLSEIVAGLGEKKPK